MGQKIRNRRNATSLHYEQEKLSLTSNQRDINKNEVFSVTKLIKVL